MSNRDAAEALPYLRFNLDDVPVVFPYPSIYPEQFRYMRSLKRALDAKGHCMLEMPTGTGKTVSLLSLIMSYQRHHQRRRRRTANVNENGNAGPSKPKSVGKLIYCTRTVQEIEDVMHELKKVMGAIEAADKDDARRLDNAPKFLAVCLSSRRNMCIHPEVMAKSTGNREHVDELCREKTAPWVRKLDLPEKQCDFFETYARQGNDAEVPSGVFTLADIQEEGKRRGWCPYFMARHIISYANVIVYNYQYMLDPKVAGIVTRELASESIVVFDEAHNIDNVCIEALSVNFNRRSLDKASENVRQLSREIRRTKEVDAQRLREEYARLVEGLQSSGAVSPNDDGLANPALPEDILNEAVPGNVREAERFVKLLGSVIQYLKGKMKSESVRYETPQSFLFHLEEEMSIASKPLRFFYIRLNSLLRTLEVTNLQKYTPVQLVADFLALVSTPAYKDGFMIIFEPYDTRTPHYRDPILQLACLDSSFAMRPVVNKFQSVVITSGTLSPLNLYPKLLSFTPVVQQSLEMSIKRPLIRPLIVTRGSDQTPISSMYSLRGDIAVVRNYGELLVELAKTVPDGIVCFFPSYAYMEEVVSKWNEEEILKRVLMHKLVFFETKDIVETTHALHNYRVSCDRGRGAVFLSVARGKVSEGIDFSNHYGRAVLLIGIPFQYSKSHILLARLDYLRRMFQINEADFLAFDALRQAAQCCGRVIRSKNDYALMVFADKRFASVSKRSKLPPWITQFLEDRHMNLATDECLAACNTFLKRMSQPCPEHEKPSLLGSDDIAALIHDLQHSDDISSNGNQKETLQGKSKGAQHPGRSKENGAASARVLVVPSESAGASSTAPLPSHPPEKDVIAYGAEPDVLPHVADAVPPAESSFAQKRPNLPKKPKKPKPPKKLHKKPKPPKKAKAPKPKRIAPPAESAKADDVSAAAIIGDDDDDDVEMMRPRKKKRRRQQALEDSDDDE